MSNWFASRSTLIKRLHEANATISRQQADLDNWGEERAALTQRISEAERRAKKMEIMRDPAGIDVAGLRIASEVEDLFARGSPGGRAQRLAQVQVLIIGVIQDALRGERDWNLGWRPKATDGPEAA